MIYPFKTKPFEHQLRALSLGWDKECFGYLMEMGTGKTKVTIDNIAMLYDAGKIDSALIIAPKGVYRNWTETEIPTHMPSHIASGMRMAHWTPSPNKAEKAAIEYLFQINDDLNVFVMNVEALSTDRGTRAAEKFLLTHKAIVVVDESTCIKNPGARRTKSILKVTRQAPYRRILTGSPVTKSPLDLYSQCAFLDWTLLGYNSFYSFRGRYAVTKAQNFGGRTIQQVVGYRNVEELADKLKRFSYRVTKDECLDLPEKLYTKRVVELSDEQKKAYGEMRRLCVTAIAGAPVTVTAVITQILRLHQITCGYIKTDEGEEIDLPNARLPQLLELLEETDGKVIIWANYRRNIASIRDALVKAYGKESVVTYYGDTSDEDREKAKVSFQDPDSPVRFFVANSQTGGYGITLTAAQTVVYFSNNYDLEKRLQSEDRAHRIGQKHNVTYIDFVTPDTVDEKILTALRSKRNIANAITGDNWKDWI